jgi:hypothetical protein
MLRNKRRSAADGYSLYLAQQSAEHHFGSLSLACGVLECMESPKDQAEWLLRIIEATDKCAVAVEECVSKSE